jgi:aspartate kinase
MKPVVMKFGGTSVEDATAILRTAKIVAGRQARGQRPVVVVSAMAKVTDQLLAAAKAAGRGDRNGALAISSRLRHRHCDTSALLLPAHRKGELQSWIQQEFESIDEILRGLSAVGELTPRTNDLVVSFGERLSSRLVAEAFRDQGIPAVHVDARSCIITDAQHGKATPNGELIEARCGQNLRPMIEAGDIPVMAGFIGSTVEGATTTLGRGGSDYTAALIGGGLDAEAIEIWTDVDGIMTADPRVCPDALRVRRTFRCWC